MDYVIEYEIRPMRAIHLGSVVADNRDEAVASFRKSVPLGRIRKINGFPAKDDGKTIQSEAQQPQVHLTQQEVNK
jgi:hypothetical protein